ncbi:hypothetical protein BH23PLA1_BH23PLA1_10680 [soil metagenome]
MRLCRFQFEEEDPLTGFYVDDQIIPIDQAVDAYCEAMNLELLVHETDNLLDLLPPRGQSFRAVRELARWIETLDTDALAELTLPIEEVHLLTPIERPGKLLLLAGNYAEHIVEGGGIAAERAETFPYVFMKPITTLAHPGDPIRIPKVSPDTIDWECELGVVIGQTCKDVSEAEALKYVAGYTVVNDISDRNFRPNPTRKKREKDTFFDWLHGKWHDGSCPIGPCIRSADSVADPQALGLKLSVNDEVMQDDSTAKMIFPVSAVVAFLSSFVTLQPGDILSTGTPSGVGKARGRFLKPGEVVVAEIEGIGRLENPVEAEG